MTALWEGFLQGLRGVWTIAIIVVPLMIILEIAEHNGLLQKLNRLLAKPFRSIGLSEEGAFPVVIAMVFGITYGSGVIINHVRTGQVTREEATVIGTFIAIAHALIEDTILFLALGAPFLLLFFPRVLLAYIMSFLVSKQTARRSAQGQNLDTVN
ncbi:MAG: hypothetical protein GX971_03070 [Firmicutes bacterium]|nr:hypothetical protein [Bacillota bacterium]